MDNQRSGVSYSGACHHPVTHWCKESVAPAVLCVFVCMCSRICCTLTEGVEYYISQTGDFDVGLSFGAAESECIAFDFDCISMALHLHSSKSILGVIFFFTSWQYASW